VIASALKLFFKGMTKANVSSKNGNATGVVDNSVRQYLNEIGQFPLLQKDEEVLFAQRVQQLIKLQEAEKSFKKMLEKEVKYPDELSLDGLLINEFGLDGQKSLDLLRMQGERAKNIMVQHNLRLVVSIAKKYQNRGLSFQDLIQEGSIGIIRAVEKFDPKKGYRFSTYAYWWIRQGITRAVAEKSREIRLPVYITERFNKLRKIDRELTQKFQRAPTFKERARAMEMTIVELEQLLGYNIQPISLNAPVGGVEGNDELGSLLEDARESDPLILAERADGKRALLEVLRRYLGYEEIEVLTMYFGFAEQGEGNMAEIGRVLGLPRPKVSRMLHRSLIRLRGKGVARELRELRY